MNKNKYKYIFILIILSLCFILSGCGKKEENNNEVLLTDEFGFERHKKGFFSESIIIDEENYNKYKNNLIGNYGESTLLNENLSNVNIDKLDNSKYYYIYLFLGKGVLNLNTYFKVSLINESEILFDNDVIDYDELIVNNYKISDAVMKDVKASFDMSLDPSKRLDIKVFESLEPYSFFSLVLPFSVKKNGLLDINFSIDNNSEYNYKNEKNYLVGNDSSIKDSFKINNYSISFISESLCKNGIDNSKLSKDANIVRRYSSLMVVDFDLETLTNNNIDDNLYIDLYVPKYDKLNVDIFDAPTSNFSEEIKDDIKILKANIKLSQDKGNKKYRLIYKIYNEALESTDINLFVRSAQIDLNNYKNDSFVIKTNYGLKFIEKDDYYSVKLNDESLTEITIPAYHNGKIVVIDSYAFQRKQNLISVILEDGIETINPYAFKDCINLKNIIIPNSIKFVGGAAFDGCDDSIFNYIDNGKYIGNESNRYFILLNPTDDNIESFSLNPNTKIIAGSAFVDKKSLKNINLFNVEYIGSDAFGRCEALTSITIPHTTKIIYYLAFSNCSSLEEVNVFSDNITFEGKVFYNCNLIKKMTLPYAGSTKTEKTYLGWLFGAESSSDQNKYIPTSLEEIKLTSCEEIYDYAFYNCTSLKKIALPDCVTSIAENSFGNIYFEEASMSAFAFDYINKAELKSVIITSGTRIKNDAFGYCNKLKKVTILDEITKIGGHAFHDCRVLEEVTLPNSIIKIEDYAFNGCDSLIYNEYDNAYYLGNNVNPYLCLVKVIDREITSCKINDRCKIILFWAFLGWANLTALEIPDSVIDMGSHLFKDCTSLQFNEYDNAYYLGNSNNPYLWLISAKSKDIKTCNINDDCKHIMRESFIDCTLLENIVIPNNITRIDNATFYNCKSLSKVTIPNSVLEIGASAFSYCESLESITIPNSVLEIGAFAFKGCTSLKNFLIPPSITIIESCTFRECTSLESVIIGSEVVSVGNCAFYECSSIKNVYYEGSKEDWDRIYFEVGNNILSQITVIYNYKAE